MQPTSPDIFSEETVLIPRVVAEGVLQRRLPASANLSDENRQWFLNYCDTYTRWLHANRRDWNRHLNGVKGRDFLWDFMGHWADAFIKDPDLFKQRHPLEALV